MINIEIPETSPWAIMFIIVAFLVYLAVAVMFYSMFPAQMIWLIPAILIGLLI